MKPDRLGRGAAGALDRRLSRMTALTTVFKLCQSAGENWRRLDGSRRLVEILRGVKFKDGEKLTERAA